MKNILNFLCLFFLTLSINSGILYSQPYWEPAGTSVTTNPIKALWSLSVADNGDIWVGANNGVFFSTNNGNTWIKTTNNGIVTGISGYPDSPDKYYEYVNPMYGGIAINPVTGSVLAAGYQGVFRLQEDGEKWEHVLVIPEDREINNLLVTPSGEIYTAGHLGIHYSNNNGDTWAPKNQGLPAVCRNLALSPDGTLYTISRVDKCLYYLPEGGDTWIKTAEKNISIGDITFSDDGTMFVAAYNDGVFKSTDKGVTWEEANNGFEFDKNTLTPTFSEITYSSLTGYLFVTGNLSGVFVSTDLGASWHNVSSGISTSSFFVVGLGVNPKTGVVYVSSDATQVYRSIDNFSNFKDNTPSVSVDEPAELPTEYNLLQNYPNPFNPTTKIEYSLSEASMVRLSIYNNLGQEVATLVNSNQAAGKYNIDFNANNLPSGIYFYKLQSDKFNAVKKMMLIK